MRNSRTLTSAAIRAALAAHQGDRQNAARALGVPYETLRGTIHFRTARGETFSYVSRPRGGNRTPSKLRPGDRAEYHRPRSDLDGLLCVVLRIEGKAAECRFEDWVTRIVPVCRLAWMPNKRQIREGMALHRAKHLEEMRLAAAHQRVERLGNPHEWRVGG